MSAAAKLPSTCLPASPSLGVDGAVSWPDGMQYIMLPTHPNPPVSPPPISPPPCLPPCRVAGINSQGGRERVSHLLSSHTPPPNTAPSWASIVHEGSSAHCFSVDFMLLFNSCIAKGLRAWNLIKKCSWQSRNNARLPPSFNNNCCCPSTQQALPPPLSLPLMPPLLPPLSMRLGHLDECTGLKCASCYTDCSLRSTIFALRRPLYTMPTTQPLSPPAKQTRKAGRRRCKALTPEGAWGREASHHSPPCRHHWHNSLQQRDTQLWSPLPTSQHQPSTLTTPAGPPAQSSLKMSQLPLATHLMLAVSATLPLPALMLPLALVPPEQTPPCPPLPRTPYQESWDLRLHCRKHYHHKRCSHCWFCNFK